MFIMSTNNKYNIHIIMHGRTTTKIGSKYRRHKTVVKRVKSELNRRALCRAIPRGQVDRVRFRPFRFSDRLPTRTPLRVTGTRQRTRMDLVFRAETEIRKNRGGVRVDAESSSLGLTRKNRVEENRVGRPDGTQER